MIKIMTTVQKIANVGGYWYVQFVGSTESINIGPADDVPPFAPGDRAEIIIRKPQ